MSKQLYEEALAEVRQLKQIAEDNAKKAIMEEVTPRIKQLIESQILENLPDSENECGAPPLERPISGQVMGDDYSPDQVSEEDAADDSEEQNVLEVSPAVESVLRSLSNTQPERLHEFKLLAHKLGKKILGESPTNYNNVLETLKAVYVLLQEKVEDSTERRKIEETLDSYYKTILEQQEINEMNRRGGRGLREASLDIKIDGFDEDVLDDDALSDLNIEIVPSTTGEEESEEEKSTTGEEEEEDLDMGDEESEEDSKEEELDFSEEDEEPKKQEESMNSRLSDNTVVEIDEGMLRREIARMKVLRETAETATPVEKKSPKGKKMTPKVLSSFGGGKSDGDAWLDGEVTTESLDEMSDLLEDNMTVELSDSSDDDDDLSEVETSDEELDEMGRHDGSDDVQITGGPTGPIKSYDEGYGGASQLEGEGCMDESEKSDDDEETSDEAYDVGSNERADTSKQARQPGATMEARNKLAQVLESRTTAIARGRRARQVMENARKAGNKTAFARAKKVYAEAAQTFVNATKAARVLQESIKRSSNSSVSRETAALRKQLAETNLFNAKLLYTNKLLQNEALSPRQKVTIIEKLDEARSIREAKLVYESLTRTISSGKERIAEGADRQVLGSASRATRPGSTVSLNEGYEASRWAKLAGITK